MEELAITTQSIQDDQGLKRQISLYHSVEFEISGLDFTYQFKLWDMGSGIRHIVVREDSDILDRLEVGNKFSIKYYSHDKSCPEGQSFETEIVHITKDDKGRFKGHCLVGRSVLGGLGIGPI